MTVRETSALRRRVAGAVLLDLAVSPLFIWNVFAQPLAQTTGASATQTSLVFSFGLVAFSVGVVAGGRMADTIAPRRLAIASALGMLAGLGLGACAASLWLIAIGFGLLQGLAAGMGYAVAVHQAGLINRGLVMALVVSAYGAGSAALAPPASWLLANYGHGAAFAALAALAFAVCMLAASLLPDRPPAPARQTTSTSPDSLSGRARLLGLLWLMFGLASAPGLAAFAIAGDLSAGTAYGAVAAVSLGNLGGRLIAGPAADRLGTRWALHASFILLIVAGVLFFSTHGHGWLWAALLITGLQYGAMSTLTPLAARAGVPARHFGQAFGIVFSAWGLVGLAAPAASAALIGHGGRPAVAVAMLACALLGWLATVAMLRRLPNTG